MSKQQEAIELIRNGHNIFLTGSGGCVDLDTEFLTSTGWVKFSDYKDQKVGVFNPEDNNLFFEKPSEFIKLPAVKLTRMKGRGLDMVLCDDHRVVYWATKSSPQPRVLPFKEVLKRHQASNAGWQGKIKTTFNYSGQGLSYNEGCLRLQVAVMADGRIVKEGKDNYTQMRFRKKRKYERLLHLCTQFDLPYKDNGLKGKEYEVIVWPKTKSKRFTSDFYDCSSEQLTIIVDEVRHWDSSIEDGSIRYVSKYQSDVDFVQFAFASCGYKTTVYRDKREGKESFRVTATLRGKGFRAYAADNNTKVLPEDYLTKDGFKYCFKVSTGMFVARRNGNIFITGNCGKSWVIEQVMDNQTLLAAPTGIAALNVGGVTCHSLFGLPFGIPSKDDLHKTPANLVKLIRSGSVKRVIIDEIGMVRADMMDLINHRLQCAAGSELPFGGIQMVVVGDFFQLEPIVTHSEQRHIKHLYDTPFAFSAKCWDFPVVELTDVYRQSDREQIELLNNVRKGVALEDTLNALVGISEPYVPSSENTVLTARKDAAAKVNDYWFNKLTTRPSTYKARTTGKFGKDTPVDNNLVLKAAARVIICANNHEHGYVNGQAGIINKCYGDTVEVLLDNGDLVSVKEHTWEKFKYTSSKGAVDKEPVGTFTQLPLRLGWAITVHKSQSLTLDEVALDVGVKGCFSHGQFYVAVSRVRDLRKLSFVNKPTVDDVIIRQEVTDWYE